MDEDEGAALEDDPLLVGLDPDEAVVLCVAPPEVLEPVAVPVVVAVVLAAVGAPPAAVAEVVAACEVVESHVTEGGRLVTPFVLQMSSAYTTAAF